MEKVLITGAGRGLGLSLTKQFLAMGSKVVACYLNSSEELMELQQSFTDRLTIIPLDVTNETAVSHAALETANQVGSLDILINNAGVHLEQAYYPLEELDFESMLVTLQVNALGPLEVAKHFIGLLEKGSRKLLLNISSEAGSISDCWRDREFDYCMSKAALNMQSRIMQNYLKPRGIKILAIHPGWMRTEMGGANADIASEEAAEGIFKLTQKQWSLDEGIYFDYLGKPLNW
ncbi:MAG TPA: SDR family oxidoreductase [Bacillota bacterium]|nr:SDR family oxidoreductase [Bacillota bacterium]